MKGSAYLLIALGGSLGAMTRVAVGDVVARRMGTGWPYATLLINVSGCLVIGFFMAGLAERVNVGWRYLVPVGFVGAYTTFSTFALETQRLADSGRPGAAAAYVVLSNALGWIAVVLGLGLGRRL